MTISTKERQRLAAILGMLGSAHAGERAAAGLQAEAFLRKHDATWAELLPREPVVAPAQTWSPAAPAPRRVTTWQRMRNVVSMFVVFWLPTTLLLTVSYCSRR